MNPVKQYISQKTGRGVSAIRLSPELTKKLVQSQSRPTRETIRSWIGEKQSYKILPRKKRSYRIIRKDRLWKIRREQLRGTRVKYKDCHFSQRMSDKTITPKQRWMHHVREARSLLRQYKNVLGKSYPLYRARVKGGLYHKDIRTLKNLLNDKKIL